MNNEMTSMYYYARKTKLSRNDYAVLLFMESIKEMPLCNARVFSFRKERL